MDGGFGKKRNATEISADGGLFDSSAISHPFFVRPSKKIPARDGLQGRPLALPRLIETLEPTQLREVLQTICERHPEIEREVISKGPLPTVGSTLNLLAEYEEALQNATPYGSSSAEYVYFRVKPSLVALIDAILDCTAQFLPPNEKNISVSLQYLDRVTEIIHRLPDWEYQHHCHHKENAYKEISAAWTIVIREATQRGGLAIIHAGGWDEKLLHHNQKSGERLELAINAMTFNAHGSAPTPTMSATHANPPVRRGTPRFVPALRQIQ